MAKNSNKKKNITAKHSQQSIAHRSFQYSQGPLPPASELIRYNEAVPDAAERILQMAERQANHRQELERKQLSAGQADSRLGLIFGLIIGLAGIVGSAVCIVLGQWEGGSILGSGTLGSLVGVFVYGSRQRRLEREKKYFPPEN